MFVTKTDWLPISNVHVPLTHTDTKFVFSSGDVQGLAKFGTFVPLSLLPCKTFERGLPDFKMSDQGQIML